MTASEFAAYGNRVTVADGVWGTFLQQSGAAPGELVELWNVRRPDDVARAATACLAAGAQIVLTNTFRANRFELAKARAASQLAEVNLAGARLAREAVTGLARDASRGAAPVRVVGICA